MSLYQAMSWTFYIIIVLIGGVHCSYELIQQKPDIGIILCYIAFGTGYPVIHTYIFKQKHFEDEHEKESI